MTDLRMHQCSLYQTRPGAAKGKRSRPDPIQAAIDGCIIQVSSSDKEDPLGLEDNQREFSPRIPTHIRVPHLAQQWQAHGLMNFHKSAEMIRVNDDFVSSLRLGVQKDGSDRGRGRQRSNAVNRQRSQPPTGRHEGYSTSSAGKNSCDERSHGSIIYCSRYGEQDVKSCSNSRGGETARRTMVGQSNGQIIDNAKMWYYENRDRMSHPRKGNESKDLTRGRLQTWLTKHQGEERIPGMVDYDEPDDVIPREGIG